MESNRGKQPHSGGHPADALTGRGGWTFTTLAWILGVLGFIAFGVSTNPFQRIWSREKLGDEVIYQTILWLVIEHPGISGTVILVLLMVSGVLGGSLGLPGLFRTPSSQDWEGEKSRRQKNKNYLYSRGDQTGFWAGFGVTILTAMAWTAIYYSEVFSNIHQFSPGHFETQNSVSIRDVFFARTFWNHGELLVFLSLTCPPFLALFLLAEMLPASSTPGVDRVGRERLNEVLLFTAGIGFGVLSSVGLALLGIQLHHLTLGFWETNYPWLSHLKPLPRDWSVFSIFAIPADKADPKSAAVVLTSFSMFVALILATYVLFATFLRRHVSPGLAICILLSLMLLAFSILTQLSTQGQLMLLVPAFALLVLCNGNRLKYRFPGMDTSYNAPTLLSLADLEKACNKTAGQARLLPDADVLKNWHKATGKEKPKLIVVATTGGAYRATFWTTVVLEELKKKLGPDFQRSIRLMTGASGGMVGAAYFVASVEENAAADGKVKDKLRDESGLDSLAPVVRQLVFGDLPGTFFPLRQQYDRGIALEDQWTTLQKSFAELKDGEEAGWRPSLIVSPMVVESGRRLLISNLDLSRLAATQPLDLPRDNNGNAAQTEIPPIYSRSAIEFFKIFPGARDCFKLSTAVRMSATFPFASPAVSLPMSVSRRVVDAGYYDNYGVDLATAWIYENQPFIREHTSGVALIQIRAYPSEEETRSFFGLPLKNRPDWINRLIERVMTSFQGITTPLGGGLSAREYSMRFRNATQVRVLDDLLNRGQSSRLFETFIFENQLDFAMNWFLSEQDIEDMKTSIGCHVQHLKQTLEDEDKGHDFFQERNLDSKRKLIHWFQQQA